jgi:hypothetical protein
MRNFIKKYITPVVCVAILIVTVSSCSKDKYYQDGGLAKAQFNGNVLQYLQSNPKFDTIAQIVKLAGMEDIFTKENITFFAPTDEVVRRTIGIVNGKIPEMQFGLNQQLYNLQKDTIKKLSDIPSTIWRKYLMRYVLKNKYLLKDFPQLDFRLRPLFPGGYYQGYNGDLSNIGVVYGTANTVRYSGYRQLCIAAIVDASNPNYYNFMSAAVASSDIQPTNGVVHVLAVCPLPGRGDSAFQYYEDGVLSTPNMSNTFGMWQDFYSEVILNK